MSRFLIFVPLIFVMVLDLCFTLLGQPENYWWDYTNSVDDNPIAKKVLTLGPIYFTLAYIWYSCSVIVISSVLPKSLKNISIIFLFIAHALGAHSWLSTLLYDFFSFEVNQFYLDVSYSVIVSLITAYFISDKIEVKNQNPQSE